MLGPETAHSPNAEDLTTIYWVMFAVAVALLVAINGALIALALRGRAARGREPRRFRGRARTQWRAAGLLTLLASALFVAGVIYTERASEVEAADGEAEPLAIRAIGQQWLWRFEYPSAEGEDPFAETFSYHELVVPVDTTIRLELESTDVVHRWSIPALGGSADAVPGRVNTISFKVGEEGSYDGASKVFSGASYAAMRARVRALSTEEYQAWLAQQGADIQAAQTDVQRRIGGSGAPQ